MSEQILSGIIRDLKKESKFKYFGISVYSPEYALRALGIDGFDFVQLPYNVFDQRARHRKVFAFAREKRKQVFVRSIYLQGLLLMDPSELGEAWDFAKFPLKTFAKFASSIGVSRKLLALAFVEQTAPEAMLVIGVETHDQVLENLDIFKKAGRVRIPEISQLSSSDPKLINPSHWQNNTLNCTEETTKPYPR
jgi:aryl-alcohol dehydrogenase-like predicted oxidoreductase